jgi:hypothetical protein
MSPRAVTALIRLSAPLTCHALAPLASKAWPYRVPQLDNEALGPKLGTGQIIAPFFARIFNMVGQHGHRFTCSVPPGPPMLGVDRWRCGCAGDHAFAGSGLTTEPVGAAGREENRNRRKSHLHRLARGHFCHASGLASHVRK